MVVAQLLERLCTLPVTEGQLQGRLVELQAAFRRVAVAGGRAGRDERWKGPVPSVLTGREIVRPGEVRPLAEEGGPVVVGDQLEEGLVALRNQSFPPAGHPGVRPRA